MDELAKIRATELQRTTNKVLKRIYLGKERLLVERDGFPMAVMIPYQEYEEFMRFVEAVSKRQSKTSKTKRTQLG